MTTYHAVLIGLSVVTIVASVASICINVCTWRRHDCWLCRWKGGQT